MIATPSHVPNAPAVVLRPLAAGTIVRLPDDTLAEVIWSSHSEVDVLHGYLRAAGLNGAGPWSYDRWQVEEATECEVRGYRAACEQALTAAVTGVLEPIWAPMAVR